MSFDEPTQRLRRPSPPQQPTGAVDTSREDARETTRDSDPTGVLPLDELFGPPESSPDTDAREGSEAGEAAEVDAPLAGTRPARAPMPVVTVRSDAETHQADSQTAPPAAAPAAEPGRSEREPGRPAPASRLRADGAAAVHAGAQHVSGWLRRDDNALTVVTALVAILLLSVVAAFGS